MIGRRACPFLLVLASACSQGAGVPPDGSGGSSGNGAAGGDTSAPPRADDDSACQPERLGLASAHRVEMVRLPEGCGLRTPPPGEALTRVTAEAELSCPPGVTSGIDFAAKALYVTSHMLSPATVGTDVYDDGAQITMVDRFRATCGPTGPHPMPAPVTLSFLVPAGAPRTTALRNCNVVPACN